MLVKIIQEVPDQVFVPAAEEISNIEWDKIIDKNRAIYSIFSSSIAISIRKHDKGNKPLPKSIEEWCMICECEDNPEYAGQFMKIRSMVDWMSTAVNGLELGKVMIVNLAPGGKVDLHIDPNAYFEKYSRYHVPFKTNSLVNFHGGPDTELEHMPYKTMCRLNNRLTHGLQNNGDECRIHLIADIAVDGGNQIF